MGWLLGLGLVGVVGYAVISSITDSNAGNGQSKVEIQTVYQKCGYCKYIERQADGTFACGRGKGFIGNDATEVLESVKCAIDLPCYGSLFEPWKDTNGRDFIDEPNYSNIW